MTFTIPETIYFWMTWAFIATVGFVVVGALGVLAWESVKWYTRYRLLWQYMRVVGWLLVYGREKAELSLLRYWEQVTSDLLHASPEKSWQKDISRRFIRIKNEGPRR